MKTECRMQKAVVSDQWSVISNQAVHGSRITHHVSRITRPSSVAPRPSERGVALVKGSDFMLEGGEDAVRIAYSGVGAAAIDEGITRLADAVASLRGVAV